MNKENSEGNDEIFTPLISRVNGNGNGTRPEAAAMRDQILQRLLADQPKDATTPVPASVPTTPLKR